jgi:hypothetical protein
MLQSLGKREDNRRLFGDIAVVVFLVAQASDGILTYIGVATYGIQMEANPLIVWLMTSMGEGPGLATAKVTAGTFGVILHLTGVHRAVAALAAFYIVVAIIPWMALLYVI